MWIVGSRDGIYDKPALSKFASERGGDLTAVQVTLEPNKEIERLGDLRDELRRQVASGASPDVEEELAVWSRLMTRRRAP